MVIGLLLEDDGLRNDIIQEKVRDYIPSCHIFEEGKQVTAAVSGGAGSVCLLHLLVGLRKELHIDISTAHVHHDIREEEAGRDAPFTEKLYWSLGVPCLVVRRDVPGYAARHSMSLEGAGRYLHYEAFGKEARRLGGAEVTVAHHNRDQAEIILYNLLRSSSLEELGGMKPVRDSIIRSLSTCSREGILDYPGQNGLTYCGDSTSADGNYTRNHLHSVIIPQLISEMSHGAVEHTIYAGDMIGQADVYIKRTAVRGLEVHGQWEEEQAGMDTDTLKRLDGIVGSYVVMEMITRLGGFSKDITSRYMALAREPLDKEADARLDLSYALTARRSYTKLWIECESKPTPVDSIPKIPLPTPVFTVLEREEHQRFPENEYTKWFDYDRIKGTLSVRTRQTEDYITLRDGKWKTVKSYMVDERIERELRDGIPPPAEGNHILWIAGYRINEYYKIVEETKKILQIQMDGGKDHGR